MLPENLHTSRAELSWSHYRVLMRIEKPEARAFYEKECMTNNWSARELERQKGSLLYERLALSKDKKGIMKLAKKGQELQTYNDMIKDPYVLEFTGLSPQSKLYENKLEQALIDNLSKFLLDLTKSPKKDIADIYNILEKIDSEFDSFSPEGRHNVSGRLYDINKSIENLKK